MRNKPNRAGPGASVRRSRNLENKGEWVKGGGVDIAYMAKVRNF